MAASPSSFAFRRSSPGAIHRRPRGWDSYKAKDSLWRKRELDRRPFALGGRDPPLGIAGEQVAVLRRGEEIEPRAGEGPQPRIARDRHPARHPDRVVAAEPRHIDVG